MSRYTLMDYFSIYVEEWDSLLEEFLRHLAMTSFSVVLALIIAVPLGIFITRNKAVSNVVIGIANVMQSIPCMALLAMGIPFLGVYSACSTMSEAFALSASMVNAGYADTVVAATGSHFSSAERQYRYPLELGCTRPPQSQWTVTGAGSAVISNKGEGVSITAATFGKVVDFGVTDVNNMGAAMAPAAADSLLTHFKDTGLAPEDYDLILTGDLGALGSRILKDLMWEKGVDISANHVDCGEVIYKVIEDEFQGGSGAGCSAVVFNSYIYDKMMRRGEIKKVLFAATGALLSTTSSQQGDSIPCISHAVVLER